MNTVRLGTEVQRATVTVEQERVFHYIADEELEMLIAGEAEPFSQIFWTAIGVFVGSLQGALAVFYLLGTRPATWVDLIPLLLAVGSAFAAGVAGYAWRRGRRNVKTLQHRIRSRHRIPVRSEAAVSDLPPLRFEPPED